MDQFIAIEKVLASNGHIAMKIKSEMLAPLKDSPC